MVVFRPIVCIFRGLCFPSFTVEILELFSVTFNHKNREREKLLEVKCVEQFSVLNFSNGLMLQQ